MRVTDFIRVLAYSRQRGCASGFGSIKGMRLGMLLLASVSGAWGISPYSLEISGGLSYFSRTIQPIDRSTGDERMEETRFLMMPSLWLYMNRYSFIGPVIAYDKISNGDVNLNESRYGAQLGFIANFNGSHVLPYFGMEVLQVYQSLEVRRSHSDYMPAGANDGVAYGGFFGIKFGITSSLFLHVQPGLSIWRLEDSDEIQNNPVLGFSGVLDFRNWAE